MEVMETIRSIKFRRENVDGVFQDAINLHREFTYSKARVGKINNYMLLKYELSLVNPLARNTHLNTIEDRFSREGVFGILLSFLQ